MHRVLAPLLFIALAVVLALSLHAAHAATAADPVGTPLLQVWEPDLPGLPIPRDWPPPKKPRLPSDWDDLLRPWPSLPQPLPYPPPRPWPYPVPPPRPWPLPQPWPYPEPYGPCYLLNGVSVGNG